jgi:DNA transformation protein
VDAGGLEDLFEPFGKVTVRRMFSGHGVYAEGLCFALSLGGEVYIKSNAETEPVFAAAGSSPFTYVAKGKPIKVGYWRLIESAYDDPEELKRWASLGLAAARGAASAKKAKGKSSRAARKTPRR